MPVTPGTILISAPFLDDPDFDKSVIIIAEYNQQGARGFVINQLFPRRLNELVEFKQGIAFPLYNGGPVEKEGLYCLHQRPDLVAGGIHLFDAVYMGGNFKQAVVHLNNKTMQEKDVKLFIGYCGWDPGQLEAEIAEGSWLIADAPVHTLFSHPATLLWEELYNSRQ